MALKCMRCGHELIIGGNFMLSEVTGAELEDDDDAIVSNTSCPYCGASYDIYDTPESEKENYPYWQENSNQRKVREKHLMEN